MFNNKAPLCFICISVLSYFILFNLPTLAQTDSNPNSPTPRLLTESEIKSKLVHDSKNKINPIINKKTTGLRLNSEIKLYVCDIQLMKGEGANAFRVYAEDAKKRVYLFSVVAINQIVAQKTIYELTIKLKDEVGFWKQPTEFEGLVFTISWRGMVSNPLQLGSNKTVVSETLAKEKTRLMKKVRSSNQNLVGYKWSGDRKRFLEQATFGPTEALDRRVRRLGPRVWLEEQFNLPYPSENNPYPDLELKPNHADVGCPLPNDDPLDGLCLRNYYSQYLNQRWMMRGIFYEKAQLRHRVSLALSQLWVTSGFNIRQARHMIEYHKVISRNAFGNYRNLMKEMTLNPAMGDYLDMWRSSKSNTNENFAREILQLFTVGLFMLNQDGTLQLDENGEPIPTYNQTTVNNFTKVFTGWEFCNSPTNAACPNIEAGTTNYIDPMYIRSASRHDDSAKTLLDYPSPVNKHIPEGVAGEAELDLALDNIFYHPNVAPFVSKFLIQHLVTSDPTSAYVGRISAVFNNNGSGVRGDLKAVIKAILLDPEARGDVKTDPNYGKLREPLLFMGNVYRRLNVRSHDGTQESDGAIGWMSEQMGQNPFYPPSVFNYYSPTYRIPRSSLTAPEFKIQTTSTAIQRINSSALMAYENLAPDERDVPTMPHGTGTDVSSYTQLMIDDPNGIRLMDELDKQFMHNTMSQTLRTNTLNAVLAVSEDDPEYRVRTAIFLIISSAEYQIQR